MDASRRVEDVFPETTVVKIKSPESDGKEWFVNQLVKKIIHGTVRLGESKSEFFRQWLPQ